MRWDEWRGSLDGRPTMLIRRLVAWRGWCLDLHRFIAPDDPGCFHTHPAYAVRVILWGGYVEELEGGRLRRFLPGRIGLVRPSTSHRVDRLLLGGTVTMWLRFPKCASIELRGPGWSSQRGAT